MKGNSDANLRSDTLARTWRAMLEERAGRDLVLAALEGLGKKDDDPDLRRLVTLAWVNSDTVRRGAEDIGKGGYDFKLIRGDDEQAHAKVAALQDLLRGLGYHLPAGATSRGYYGGPAGPPLVLALEDVNALRRQRARRERLITEPEHEQTESWTRDAVRRLQGFLGARELRLGRTPAVCLARPDGLFGRNTLAALGDFLEAAGRGTSPTA